MQIANIPLKFYVPFAQNDSSRVEIPITTTDTTRASQSLGFPPLTMQPPESGGVPPQGEDFNGAMNQIARIAWWLMAGGPFIYDATFSGNSNVNGYPQGARVATSDYLGAWLSTVDNNQNNPDTTGTNWVPAYNYGNTTITLTNANVTLTPLQAAKPRLTFTGTLTGNVVVTLPAWVYEWQVVNNTIGTFTLTLTTVGGSGAVIPSGGIATVYGDGTNIIFYPQTVPPATSSTQAAQLGQTQLGLIGASRNLHATQTAAASTLTISADQTIVASSLNGMQYAIPNWSLTLNIGTVGAGGIDTGSAPTFSSLAIYLIYNPTTQTAALLATLANTIIAPTIYSAGHMPSGYTASALISVWPTDGGAHLIAATQIDRSIYRPAVTAFTTTTNAISPTSQGIAGAVPPNARSFGGYVSFSNTTSNVSSSMVIGSDANMSGAKSTNYVNPSGSATGGQNFDNVAIFTTQTIYFTSGNTSGTTTYTVSCTVYTI